MHLRCSEGTKCPVVTVQGKWPWGMQDRPGGEHERCRPMPGRGEYRWNVDIQKVDGHVEGGHVEGPITVNRDMIGSRVARWI